MSVVISDERTQQAAPAGERLLGDAARAAESSHARLSGLLTDMFLPDAHRANDRTRAVMARLFDQLVGAVEADLRAILTPHFESEAPDVAVVLASERVTIALPILHETGLLRDAELVQLLLARTEEHRIVLGLRRIAESGLDPAPALAPPDDVVAAAADHALRLAENDRIDAAYEPVMAASDLPAALLRRVVWRVAAALRDYLVRVRNVAPEVADRHIAAAGAALLAAHDADATLEAAALRLAARWRELGVDDDARLHHALRQGRFVLFAAMLAVRAGIGVELATAMAADRDIARLAVLLRGVGVDRDTAVMALFEMAAIHGLPEQRLIACSDAYDRLDPAVARASLQPPSLDPGYRSAVAALAVERTP
ncbi:DUF2336 domain-containing protein [Sphingomonas flavalba]|uniref:DUF2336 domain-containing protein n=1 Tax=Sphingomonas flavalba TaxID=2559804 RepID=UPI0039E056EF